MARKSKQRRYEYLVSRHFTPMEAREFSILKKETPALKEAVQRRETRRAKFERMAASKIARGMWRRGDVPRKWRANLSRLYTKNGWRVQEGPRGDQQAMPRGSPNPWAMYRTIEKIAPPKKDVSPWQLRRIFGKTRLQRGLILIQQAEKRGGLRIGQLHQWVVEKDAAIRKARGQRRRDLIIERDRLNRLLTRRLTS